MKKYLAPLVLFLLFITACSDEKKDETTNCISPAEWKGDYLNLDPNVIAPMHLYLGENGKGWQVYTDGKKDINYKIEGDFLFIQEYNKYKIIECTGEKLIMEKIVMEKGKGEYVSAKIDLEKVK
jgi:hypothetical protein